MSILQRRIVLAGLIFGMPGIALAQGASLDGTWTGTTQRGGSVQITVAGNQAQSYVFRGQPVPVSGSRAFGNTLSFQSGSTGTVTLTKGRGNTAQYSYSDTSGGNAAATLTRQ